MTNQLPDDLKQGPSFYNSHPEQVNLWKKVIWKLHHESWGENLVAPSFSHNINQAVVGKGYTLLKLSWSNELIYLDYDPARKYWDRKCPG